jgi:hypothetical protein
LGEAESGGGLVHKINRFVREVPIGYIPGTIHGRCKNVARLDFGNGKDDEGSADESMMVGNPTHYM